MSITKIITICLQISGMLFTASAFRSAVMSKVSVTRQLASSVNDIVPSKILCDIIESSTSTPQCKVNEAQDFGEVLKGNKKAVLFAVPGAFTPTCSVSHLPGYISLAEQMKSKGVDAIYCLSVNDRFVMKSWGDATSGFAASGVQLVADGNGEFTAALGLSSDKSGGRMGMRSQRYAMIVESGKITSINIDDKGLEKSAAEYILSLL